MPSTLLPAAERAARLARLERLADRLDSAFRIPGLGVRIGWDGILGVVPGIGDALGFAPAAFILMEARKLGVRNRTLPRMATNTLLDTVIGGIPLLGDLFDVAFKSNRRNVAIIRRELHRDPEVARAAPAT